MPVLSTPTNSTPVVTLTFNSNELSQLEAFATLHGESVTAFIQKAALDAAHIAPANKSSKNSPNDLGALWLSNGFIDIPEAKEPDLFAPVDAQKETETVDSALAAAPVAVAAKRGMTGEQSHLAKGRGLVWEIRQALGRERVHGLGRTREQLAFVLKLSVMGVRKMEHQGTSPVKSLESRKALLGLAKTLENSSPEIASYIEREEAALQT